MQRVPVKHTFTCTVLASITHMPQNQQVDSFQHATIVKVLKSWGHWLHFFALAAAPKTIKNPSF